MRMHETKSQTKLFCMEFDSFLLAELENMQIVWIRWHINVNVVEGWFYAYCRLGIRFV